MKVVINNHAKTNETNQRNVSDTPLCNVLTETLNQKGIEDSMNCWENDKTLVADGIPQLALHSFLLKAEQLGKSYTMERKLTITFNE